MARFAQAILVAAAAGELAVAEFEGLERNNLRRTQGQLGALCDARLPDTDPNSCSHTNHLNAIPASRTCTPGTPDTDPLSCLHLPTTPTIQQPNNPPNNPPPAPTICDSQAPATAEHACTNPANATRTPCVEAAPASNADACVHIRPVAGQWLCDSEMPAAAPLHCLHPDSVGKTQCQRTVNRQTQHLSCGHLDLLKVNSLCDSRITGTTDPVACTNPLNVGKVPCDSADYRGEEPDTCAYLKHQYADRLCNSTLSPIHPASCSHADNGTRVACDRRAWREDPNSCYWLESRYAAGLCDARVPADHSVSCANTEQPARVECTTNSGSWSPTSCAHLVDQMADLLCSPFETAEVSYSCNAPGNAGKVHCQENWAAGSFIVRMRENWKACGHIAVSVQRKLCDPDRDAWVPFSCSRQSTRWLDNNQVCVNSNSWSNYLDCFQMPPRHYN